MVPGFDVGIVERNLFRVGVVRHQRGQEDVHREPRRRESGEPAHEGAPVDEAMSVFVIPIERLLGDWGMGDGFGGANLHRVHGGSWY